ncbi:MAG: ATP-binding protein [Candidatus Thiodiazotropha sp.]
MRINRHDRDVLIDLLKSSEDRLIDLILHYANQEGYTRYTSTLKEAWRLSIEGLTTAIVEVVERSDMVPELNPEEDFSSDSATRFGVREAQRHRGRGVNLSMFLGLMKYYRQSYVDLLTESGGFDHPESVDLLVRRFFDRTELAYCDEWAGTDAEAQIKELSRNNLQLATEKNKYLTLFESLSSPVVLCDENGKVDNYNNAAGRLLLGSDTPGSRYYAEQRNDLEPPGLHHELGKMKQKGLDHWELEKRYTTPEGERTYAVQIERMLDVSHKFAGYTILFNDITETLEWGAQLAQINREQKQLIEDLNSTRQQLVQSEKMAAIGQLASGVAHEINTPIQYIGENIQFMQEAFGELLETAKMQLNLLSAGEEGSLPRERVAQARSQLEEVDLDYLLEEIPLAVSQSLDGVGKVSGIVSAMKDFARPGTNDKVDIDINAAVMSTVEVSANEWKYHAEMDTDLDPLLPLVPVVPSEINQALLNVIVNAAAAVRECAERRASKDKGKIKISTRRDGAWVVIEISDTGCGIPREIHSKIFDPFFTTRDVGQATGQGLTVAYLAVVKKHAGEIALLHSSDEGTTFEIRLPVKAGINEAAERKLWRQSGRFQMGYPGSNDRSMKKASD